MKIKLGILTACAALLLTVSVRALQTASPDGQFEVKTGPSSIEVLNASGEPVLLLQKRTIGNPRVEVAWSPDGRRVVVAENFPCGSEVLAAWREGNVWHRGLEGDEGLEGLGRALQRQGLGRVVAEHRTLKGWVSPDALEVTGEMTLSGGRRVAYAYTLRFVSAPGHLDRGGYEEGVIKGTNYRLNGE
jgi:hypothetical protein